MNDNVPIRSYPASNLFARQDDNIADNFFEHNFILLGPPGAGKGTQGKMLAIAWNIPHISTGDMLRMAVKSETEIGKNISNIMGTGKLVPDEFVIKLIEERLYLSDTKNGFILDGYPRTLAQAETIENLMHRLSRQPICVIEIRVSREQVIERLAGRLGCSKCGALYHINFAPPLVNNICNVCGEKLTQRKDDQYDIISRRQDVYENDTAKLIPYYTALNMLYTVDGTADQHQVLSNIIAKYSIQMTRS